MEVTMQRSVVLVVLVVSTLSAIGPVSVGFAQKFSAPKPVDKFALGENEVRNLLAVMDSDGDGKVSRQEFAAFMDAEFERLSKRHSGELDVKELTQATVQASYFAKVGK
jgi:hypothetical protein